MTTYFTSDLHFGHTAILAFAQRPWKSIEEHDAAIIDNINATVGRNDKLYVLGDFTMRMHTADVQPYLEAIACKISLYFSGEIFLYSQSNPSIFSPLVGGCA